MPSMQTLVLQFIDPNDTDKAEEFAEWAFGEDYKEYDRSYDFLKAWNILHGKELMLEGHGVPSEDMPKMIELWKNR